MSRFSLNQATTKRWPIDALVAGCLARDVTQVGLWRDNVAEFGLTRTADLIQGAGLTVTSLCRGGFFTTPGWREDNLRAIEEAATLGAHTLVLVSGGLPDGSRDLDGARAQVSDALAELAPTASASGVRLALEPLHPMFTADRCVVATLHNALDLITELPASAVGVVIDTYHLWWDETIWTNIARAGRENRIACFQVADWTTPLPAGVLLGRALPGDGCIDLRRFREAVDAAGYTGPIEVEVFHEDIWNTPGPEILDRALTGVQKHVL